ncbi:hypothetical protein [Actinomarinicola tropica]|uniref:Lipoprotein n=1 Tax=Actinomarinicola tropica TaxID=2789776 RepID=A0A5Q2RK54_9ACTN|nr:hypothetical protein [Actinomarinicola tropica]QGG95864.1 hypothetical protein GH723_12570 [Actinomarinicola tropica]
MNAMAARRLVVLTAATVLVATGCPGEYGGEHEWRLTVSVPLQTYPQTVVLSDTDADKLGLDDQRVALEDTSRSANARLDTNIMIPDGSTERYCFEDDVVIEGGGTTEVLWEAGVCVSSRTNQPITD